MALPHHSGVESFSKPMNLATKLGHYQAFHQAFDRSIQGRGIQWVVRL